MKKKRVAVLISGSGSNLQALIDAAQDKNYPAEITLVISNNPRARGLGRAKSAGIESVVIDHREYKNRAAFDAAMQKELKQHAVDIVCLAGFMRLLSDDFVHSWQGRMLNVHPSLLPDFKGMHAVRDALAAGATQTGCTVHLVTPEMDSGPVLMQEKVDILRDDTEETLRARIHEQEHLLYPKALRDLAESF